MSAAQIKAKQLELASRLESPKGWDNQRESERSRLFIGGNFERIAVLALNELSEHAKATAWCLSLAEKICLAHEWELNKLQLLQMGTFVLHQMVLMDLCKLDFSHQSRYKCYVIVIKHPALGRNEPSTSPVPFPLWTRDQDKAGNRLTAPPAYSPEPWQFNGAPPKWLGEKWEQRLWHPYVDREMRTWDFYKPVPFLPPANKVAEKKRRKVYKEKSAGPVDWIKAINNIESNAYRINKDVLNLILELDATLPKHLVPKTKAKKPTRKTTKRIKAKRIIFEAVMKRAVQLAEHERFYQRCFVDYRGRIFLSRSILNYQGDDVARSLIEFADGVELNKQGFDSLLLHTANLAELKGTVKERQREARKCLKKWIGYAKEPIKTYSEWSIDDKGEPLDDPMLFIRACMELRDATTNSGQRITKGFISHIPVEVDQSNSVIQHLAMMQHDDWNLEEAVALAKKSGLIGHADLYTELAKGLSLGIRLTEKEKRKLVKKVVVPRAYGSGAAKIVSGELADLSIPALDALDTNQQIQLVRGVIRYLASPLGLPQIDAFHSRVERLFNTMRTRAGKTPPIRWTMPTGFTVELAPLTWQSIDARVAISRENHLKTKGYGDVQLQARVWREELDTEKVIKSIKAAIIHSCDAAVAHKVCTDNRFPHIPVHDAWACHANNVEELRTHFLNAFAWLHGPEGLPWYFLLKENLDRYLPKSQKHIWQMLPTNLSKEQVESLPKDQTYRRFCAALLKDAIS